MPENCPTPHKRPFRDEAHARRRLSEILASPRTTVLPKRCYECECGAWHLSHREGRTIERPTPIILAHAAAERRSAQ